MKTFDELYRDILKRKIRLDEPLPADYDPYHLDCLLHPEKYAPVLHIDECQECAYERACQNSCIFDAIRPDEEGKLTIRPDLCAGCEACIEACRDGRLTASRDVLPAMKAVREAKGPAYMMVAPAFFGQFSEKVTPGQLRTAFKALGFTGMVEVALFADILTLKEALEFDRHVQHTGDYQLTSCCCPIWISMIRKEFEKIAGHLPPAVSPMIACGRIAKELHRGCKTIFVGPCLAKKAEIREPDLMGDIDCVLTFQELQDIFEALEVDFSKMEEDENEHSAAAGRLYARTGGVSQAVKESLASLDEKYDLKPVCACGVAECKEMLQKILDGHVEGNFFEGMACPGGCVGGPKRIMEIEKTTELVNEYADQAKYRTPGENPYVLDLIQRLGFHTVEDFIENSRILTRTF